MILSYPYCAERIQRQSDLGEEEEEEEGEEEVKLFTWVKSMPIAPDPCSNTHEANCHVTTDNFSSGRTCFPAKV